MPTLPKEHALYGDQFGSSIGRGWDPLKANLAGYPLGTAGVDYGIDPGLLGQSVVFGFDVVDNRTALETAFSGKFSAAGKFAVASGEAGASFSQKRKKTKHTVSAVGFCSVVNTPLVISGPVLTPEANELLSKSDKLDFFRRYGSKYIEHLVTGGSLMIQYVFESVYSEEVDEVSAYLKGKHFLTEAAGEFQSKISEIAQLSNLSLRVEMLGGSLSRPTSSESAAIIDWVVNSVIEFAATAAYGAKPYPLFYRLADYGNLSSTDIDIDNALLEKETIDQNITELDSFLEDARAVRDSIHHFVSDQGQIDGLIQEADSAILKLRDQEKALAQRPFDPPATNHYAIPLLPALRVYSFPTMSVSAICGPFQLQQTVVVGNGQFINDGRAGAAGSLCAFAAAFNPPVYGLGIEYSAHLSSIGDTGWYQNGAPTLGYYNIEGLTIRLFGPAARYYDVAIYYYHDAEGWKNVQQGEFMGSRGRQGRVEAIKLTVSGKAGRANT
jgi:hypothetical protein